MCVEMLGYVTHVMKECGSHMVGWVEVTGQAGRGMKV